MWQGWYHSKNIPLYRVIETNIQLFFTEQSQHPSTSKVDKFPDFDC